MTKDEAVKYLIMPICTSTVENEEYRKQHEAYMMAIEALKTESIPMECIKKEIEMYKNDMILAAIARNVPNERYYHNCVSALTALIDDWSLNQLLGRKEE